MRGSLNETTLDIASLIRATLAAIHRSTIHANGPANPIPLLHHVELHLRQPAIDHAQRIGGGMGDVDNSSGNVGAAVVDPNRHRMPVADIGDAQPRAERQGRMRGRQLRRVEFLAARGSRALRVEAGNPLRGARRRGGMFRARRTKMTWRRRAGAPAMSPPDGRATTPAGWRRGLRKTGSRPKTARSPRARLPPAPAPPAGRFSRCGRPRPARCHDDNGLPRSPRPDFPHSKTWWRPRSVPSSQNSGTTPWRDSIGVDP